MNYLYIYIYIYILYYMLESVTPLVRNIFSIPWHFPLVRDWLRVGTHCEQQLMESGLISRIEKGCFVSLDTSVPLLETAACRHGYWWGAQDVPVSPSPWAAEPVQSGSAGNREEPSLASDTGRARHRRQTNRRYRNQARHEDRRDRGEPSWHWDSRACWHQPRPLPGLRPESETGQVDPLMINDPWANNSTPLRGQSSQALQKVGDRSARVERRIRRRHVSSSGSTSSASESSSTSSSSSTRSRRRRKDKKKKKKKVDHSRNVKIPTRSTVVLWSGTPSLSERRELAWLCSWTFQVNHWRSPEPGLPDAWGKREVCASWSQPGMKSTWVFRKTGWMKWQKSSWRVVVRHRKAWASTFAGWKKLVVSPTRCLHECFSDGLAWPARRSPDWEVPSIVVKIPETCLCFEALVSFSQTWTPAGER